MKESDVIKDLRGPVGPLGSDFSIRNNIEASVLAQVIDGLCYALGRKPVQDEDGNCFYPVEHFELFQIVQLLEHYKLLLMEAGNETIPRLILDSGGVADGL